MRYLKIISASFVVLIGMTSCSQSDKHDEHETDGKEKIAVTKTVSPASKTNDEEAIDNNTLKERTKQQLNRMLQLKLIKPGDYDQVSEIIFNDFAKLTQGKQTEQAITQKIKTSLSKLRKLEIGMEEEEFIAEIYYNLALNQNANSDTINDILSEWLYGKEYVDIMKEDPVE